MSGPQSGRAPGEQLVRVGAVVFAAGVVGVLLAVVPFLFGRGDAPAWTALLALLLPVGLGMALGGLLRGARARRRAQGRAHSRAQGRAQGRASYEAGPPGTS